MGSPLPTPVSTASSGRPVPGQALDLPATRALAALPQLPSSQGRDSAGFAAIRKAVPLDGSIAPGVPTCLAPAPTQVLSLRPSPREKKKPSRTTIRNQTNSNKKRKVNGYPSRPTGAGRPTWPLWGLPGRGARQGPALHPAGPPPVRGSSPAALETRQQWLVTGPAQQRTRTYPQLYLQHPGSRSEAPPARVRQGVNATHREAGLSATRQAVPHGRGRGNGSGAPSATPHHPAHPSAALSPSPAPPASPTQQAHSSLVPRCSERTGPGPGANGRPGHGTIGRGGRHSRRRRQKTPKAWPSSKGLLRRRPASGWDCSSSSRTRSGDERPSGRVGCRPDGAEA